MATTIKTTLDTTSLSTFVNSTFTYTKGKGDEKETLSTTIIGENFGRLPNRKVYKDTEFGKCLHSLYINNGYMLSVKGSNQREKYAHKTEEAISSWFKFCGIEDTTSNRYALFEAMGVKKSTKTINKDTEDECKQIDSALASESTFTKNVLFVCHTFITKGVWVTKNPTGVKADTSVQMTEEEVIKYICKAKGISVEQYKAALEAAILSA